MNLSQNSCNYCLYNQTHKLSRIFAITECNNILDDTNNTNINDNNDNNNNDDNFMQPIKTAAENPH